MKCQTETEERREERKMGESEIIMMACVVVVEEIFLVASDPTGGDQLKRIPSTPCLRIYSTTFTMSEDFPFTPKEYGINES